MTCKNPKCGQEINIREVGKLEEFDGAVDIQIRCPNCSLMHYHFHPVDELTFDIDFDIDKAPPQAKPKRKSKSRRLP